MNNSFINPKLWNTADRVALSATIDDAILVSASLTSVSATVVTQSGTLSSTLVNVAAISATAHSASDSSPGVFNVVNYGAVGDLVTNCYPAFSAAVSAAYAWAIAHSGSGATVMVPDGNYVLSSTLDMTRGDLFGSGSGYQGWARIKLQGQSRYNTTIYCGMGTGSHGFLIGSYTQIADVSITTNGTGCLNMIEVLPMSGTANTGRAGERIKMDRVFLRGNCAGVSLHAPGGFFMEFDTVQALNGVKIEQGTASLGAHNAYDSLFENCEVANAGNPAVPALEYWGYGLTYIGGLLYTANPSSQPGLLLSQGSAMIIGTDMDYTAVSSVSGYDIVIGSPTSSAIATIQNVNFPSRSYSSGVMGNIFVRSGTQGGAIIGNSWFAGTPSIDIEAGAHGMSIIDPALSSSMIHFLTGTSLSAYQGMIVTKDKTNLDVLTGSVSIPLASVSSSLSSTAALLTSVSGVVSGNVANITSLSSTLSSSNVTLTAVSSSLSSTKADELLVSASLSSTIVTLTAVSSSYASVHAFRPAFGDIFLYTAPGGAGASATLASGTEASWSQYTTTGTLDPWGGVSATVGSGILTAVSGGYYAVGYSLSYADSTTSENDFYVKQSGSGGWALLSGSNQHVNVGNTVIVGLHGEALVSASAGDKFQLYTISNGAPTITMPHVRLYAKRIA